MAVVQISRIQIRRGRKNQGSGLPQLASGEFGWAVDTQELYIGNGAVSEGAPYVGNTQILTEHDDLFQYASNYTYRALDGWIEKNGVQRSLQDRLDDRVSVRAFGCFGDGTDQTAALQLAIDQLFVNSANKANPQSRVVLYVEPGTYTLSSTIYLPPYTSIVGAGVDKTVFIFNGTGTAFKTVNGDSTPENPADDSISTYQNQARGIYLDGFSLSVPINRIGLTLQSCRDSIFKNIKIVSYWYNQDTIDTQSIGVKLNSLSGAVTCSKNLFENVVVERFAHGIYSDWDVYNNTFDNCHFNILGYGVLFGYTTIPGSVSGKETGPFDNTVQRSTFQDIDYEAFWVKVGTRNISRANKYYRVGNLGGTTAAVTTSVIRFDVFGNHTEGDWFERTTELGTDPLYLLNIPYIPEVKGNLITDFNFTQTVNITEYGEFTKLFRLPAEIAKGIEIEYVYRSNAVNATRNGTLKLVIDPEQDQWSLTDDYEFVGNSSYAESLEFKAHNYDENGDTVVDTVAIMVLNSTSSDDAEFYYRVKTKA